jgi:hypothetical protein
MLLVEQHEEASDLYALRVELTPPADRIERRYRQELNQVLHIFQYENGQAPASIHVTARQRITDGGVSPTDPILVVLPDI